MPILPRRWQVCPPFAPTCALTSFWMTTRPRLTAIWRRTIPLCAPIAGSPSGRTRRRGGVGGRNGGLWSRDPARRRPDPKVPLLARLEFIGNCIIFFSAFFAVLERGKIDGGTVGLSLSYAMSVTQTLNWMVRMSSQLETDIVAVERVDEYCGVSAHDEGVGWPRGELLQWLEGAPRRV